LLRKQNKEKMTNENNDVYNKLSAPNDDSIAAAKINQGWTVFLFTCTLTVCLASFTFGYNIGVTNLPTPLIQEFYMRRYSPQYYEGIKAYAAGNQQVDALKAKQAQLLSAMENMTDISLEMQNKSDVLNASIVGGSAKLALSKEKLDEGAKKIESVKTLLWTLTTSIFVVGGMIGALTSKYVAQFFGRKKGILFHYVFVIIGGVLCVIAPLINSPECVMLARFLFGVQGGMACGLIPTYLAEISPNALRGATGVLHQLCLTVGIAVSQVLGFRQVLGTAAKWSYLLALPIVPALVGALLLLVVFPESPSSLLNKYKDRDAAESALKKLRNSKNVTFELDEMDKGSKSSSEASVSIVELLTSGEYRWPLITGLVLQLAQQLCGINAVFFYSSIIFDSVLSQENIQYAVLLTGVINVVATVVVVPLIDRLGRRPLLIYPMIFIVVDFIALTIFLVFSKSYSFFPILSIVCIILFIISFAVGLGPIPFLYVAECFRDDARSTALAICMFTNWLANLVLTLAFPYMQKLLQAYTFLVFTVIVAVSVAFIIKKIPETKGRSVDEIMAKFDPKSAQKYAESSGKFLSNTNV